MTILTKSFSVADKLGKRVAAGLQFAKKLPAAAAGNILGRDINKLRNSGQLGKKKKQITSDGYMNK